MRAFVNNVENVDNVDNVGTEIRQSEAEVFHEALADLKTFFIDRDGKLVSLREIKKNIIKKTFY